MESIKTIKKDIITEVDSETGELLDVSINEHKIVMGQDKFTLVYANFWNNIMESNLSASDIELLAYLISNYSDGTPFSISLPIKTDISKSTGKSPSSYDRTTKKLLDAKFIYSVGGRTYKLNPRYAFQGSSKNRKKAIIEMIGDCSNC